MKGFLVILLALLVFCAPRKKEIQDEDLKRLMERMAQLRLSQNLSTKDTDKLPRDREIFLEACQVLRLDPNSTLDKMKESHQKLYKHLKENEE